MTDYTENTPKVSIDNLLKEIDFSILQLDIDRDEMVRKDKILVAIDCIFRIHFPGTYIVFTDKDYKLLTGDEKKYINGTRDNLIFIKNIFFGNWQEYGFEDNSYKLYVCSPNKADLDLMSLTITQAFKRFI